MRRWAMENQRHFYSLSFRASFCSFSLFLFSPMKNCVCVCICEREWGGQNSSNKQKEKKNVEEPSRVKSIKLQDL